MAIFGEILAPISAPVGLVILVITLILFSAEKIKSGITAIASSAVMVLCGFITPAEFTSGFSNSVTIFVVGIMVIGAAVSETGCVTFIGKKLLSFVHLDEKGTICLLFTLVAVMSMFLSNLACAIVGIYLSIAICQSSQGKFRKRYFIMAMAEASIVGGGISMIGSTAQLAVAAILPDMGMEMHMWDLAKPGIVVPIIFIAWYYFFGYRLMVKTFDFPEPEEMKSFELDSQKEFNPKSFKAWLPVLVLVACIAFIVFGWNIGLVAMICMCVVIVTGCISFKKAIESIDWNIFFLIAGGVGLAAGIQNAGTAEMIANWVVGVIGSAPGVIYLVVFTILTAAISNIIPNISAALIMTPIAAAVAESIGISVYPMVLCVVWGSNMSYSTPIGAVVLSLAMMGGYRFKDYVTINIIPNIVVAVVLALLTPLFWPL